MDTERGSFLEVRCFTNKGDMQKWKETRHDSMGTYTGDTHTESLSSMERQAGLRSCRTWGPNKFGIYSLCSAELFLLFLLFDLHREKIAFCALLWTD